MGDGQRFDDLLARLDAPDFGEIDDAWAELEPFGPRVARESLAAYKRFRNWQGRTTLVLKMTRYARTEAAVRELGLAALKDASPVVRTRACALLAYAQNDEAIPAIETLLDHADKSVRDAAAAAIDAIRSRNHHYFLDRSHSGKTHWDPEKD